jgi:hypothetical protein
LAVPGVQVGHFGAQILQADLKLAEPSERQIKVADFFSDASSAVLDHLQYTANMQITGVSFTLSISVSLERRTKFDSGSYF